MVLTIGGGVLVGSVNGIACSAPVKIQNRTWGSGGGAAACSFS